MKSYILVFSFLLVNVGFSQKISDSVILKVFLRDGSIYQGYGNLKNIDIITSYGKLKIPVTTLKEIKLKINYDTIKSNNIVTEIKKNLKSMNKNEVETLIDKYSTNLYLASQILNNQDSLSEIVSENLSKIDAALSDRNFNLMEEIKTDIINNEKDFREFECSITPASFSDLLLKTPYSLVTINRVDIVSIQLNQKYVFGSEDEDIVGFKKFKLFANKNISGNVNKKNAWLNTGIKIKHGDSIYIKAKGKIKLESLSGNIYSPNGKSITTETIDETTLKYGKVIFKIDNSKTISQTGIIKKNPDSLFEEDLDYDYEIAGDNYAELAKKEGQLLLSIYETLFNIKNSGFYTVYVKIGNKK